MVVLLLFVPCCADGSESGQLDGATPAPTAVDMPSAGRWHPLPEAAPALEPEQARRLAELRSLPYVTGRYPAPAAHGVTVLHQDQVEPGLNLYNSGHGPEALAISLKGEVLHKWTYPIEEIWPNAKGPHQSTYWRRVTWLPNGDVLAIFEGIGLICLDRGSRLKWAYRGMVHHQAVVDRDGSIVALTRKRRIVPWINPSEAILEDYVTRFSPNGRVMAEVSLLGAFERSPFHSLLDGMRRQGDIFHTNSIEILADIPPGRPEWQRPGNLLLSMLFLDTICVLDWDRQEIVWACRGNRIPSFIWQHDPRLLPDGNILLFDNRGRDGRSKVIDFEPSTGRIRWQYPLETDVDFFTATCGTSQRLPNGNTLVTESERGRALEVTPEGEIVWEFFNPHRAGQTNELIATLFEMRRVPADYFDRK